MSPLSGDGTAAMQLSPGPHPRVERWRLFKAGAFFALEDKLEIDDFAADTMLCSVYAENFHTARFGKNLVGRQPHDVTEPTWCCLCRKIHCVCAVSDGRRLGRLALASAPLLVEFACREWHE
jgi:hypothetical protein